MTRIPQRRAGLLASALGATLVASLLTALPAAAADPPAPVTFHSDGNPILADGSYYSADAAPLAASDGKLYIYAGHDEAAPQQAGFEMHDYGIFSTDDVASGDWTLHKDALDPDEVFSWATGDNAYAGETVEGADGKYYWYVPVQSDDSTVPNAMAIGVAVSDTPVGPWTDPIGKPLLTWTDVFGSSANGQEVIDPHVFVDTDGKGYLYWGSWSVARVIGLAPSLTATTGSITTMSGLTGFYEAPWVFERNGTYYLVYDWKQGGSACTPSNYQACIAYATSSSPTGPWSYKGIILGGTSATTVHPSVLEYDGKWYITYHTKDAVGGGHFRRSVAIDEVSWDGDTILPVTPTRADDPRFRLTTNVAPEATAAASFTEQPPMRLGALNDGRATTALLPPDQWGNYHGTTSTIESDWVSYQWDAPVRTGSVGIQFQQDSNWIRPPASWKLEYLDASGDWKPVEGATYPTAANTWNTVTFTPVTTTALRATFAGRAEGAYYHSVSVSEWEVYGVVPTSYAPVDVATKPGVAPALPEAVRVTVDGQQLWSPVTWRPVAASDYADEGTFTVEGRALGFTSAYVTATVTVDDEATTTPVADTAAPVVQIAAIGTQGGDGWYSTNVVARVLADDAVDYRTTISTRVGDADWVATPGVRSKDVTVSASGTTVIRGKAQDAAGNTSAEVTRTVKIDKVAPTANAQLDAGSRSVTVTASDALSGLGSIQYRFDSAPTWTVVAAGTAVPAPDALPHLFVYRVLDVAGNVTTGTVQVPLGSGTALTGNLAPYATPTTSFASGWAPATGLNDGTGDVLGTDAGDIGAGWGTWPQVGEQWARLTWDFDVTTDTVAVWWDQDSEDSAGEGLIAPASWVVQYLDADGTTWREVALDEGSAYARTRGAYVPVHFAPVTTRAIRVLAQSWGQEEAGGSIGIRELQVVAAAPVVDGVVPAAPTFTDGTVCTAGSPEQAQVVVPDVEGVVYRLDGEVVSGTVDVAPDAQVTLTAEAADGYALADGATASWSHTFVAPDCPVQDVVVTPVAPTAKAATCQDGEVVDGTVVVPTVTGVRYTIDGEPVSGPVAVEAGAMVSVVARPEAGYTFEGATRATTYAFAFPVPDCTPAPGLVVPGTVKVTGSATVGGVLTATAAGWSPAQVRLAYRWSSDGAPIAGATGRSLTLTPALRGTVVTVRVSGFGDGLIGTSVASAPVGPVGLGTLAVGKVRLSGTAKVASRLTAVSSGWPSGAKLSYRWLVDGKVVAGATGTSFVVRAADRGHRVQAQVRGAATGYVTTAWVSSAQSSKVAAGTFVAPKPIVSGTAKAGKTLKVKVGSWSPTATTVQVRWSVGGKVVKGATGTSYKVRSADKGKKITVAVTGKRAGFTTKTVTSSSVTVRR